MYGVRPFLKGAIHALLYDYFLTQISLLLTVEIASIICMFVVQYMIQNQKSIIFFMCESIVSGCLVTMNVLILLRYEYYFSNKVMEELLEECTVVVVYVMMGILVMRVIHCFLPLDFIKSLLKYD